MDDVLRILGAADLSVERLGVQQLLSVACIVSEMAVVTIERAAAAGTVMPMSSKQFPSVARHLAHAATKCTIDSIKQASKASHLKRSRHLLAEFKKNSATIHDDELEESVFEIIEQMDLSPIFPKSLLQPLPEALKRISDAWESMQDEKVAALTPARKQHLREILDEKILCSSDELKAATMASLLQGQASMQHEVAELNASLRLRSEIDNGNMEEVKNVLYFNTEQQAEGFEQVGRGIGQVRAVALQSLENLETLSAATANEHSAAQAHREQSERDGRLLRATAGNSAESFRALFSMVTK